MMIETKLVRQFEGAVQRRWFSDDYFDLIVWEDGNDAILRFELYYGKNKDEHAFLWNQQADHCHFKVDDGEGMPGRHKMSPILIADGYFDRETIAARFLEAGKEIDQNLIRFVYSKLTDYNETHGKDKSRPDRDG